MIYEQNGVYVSAKNVSIGKDVTFGKNVDIRCIDEFVIGDRSHLGDDVKIRGRSVRIGTDLYHSRGLDVGGGGCDRPRSTLKIGDRCTMHTGHINLAESVVIGNDVGLSPEVTLYSHYFWKSVLEGYPARMAPIAIKNWTIVGYRSTILPGVTIGPNSVIGAHSLVSKDLEGNAIYAGTPAKKIADITEPSFVQKRMMVDQIVTEYMSIARYHGIRPVIHVNYPFVKINGCTFNVEALTFEGQEDETTDDWRDHARRYGLRWYSTRPFKSALGWDRYE